MLRNAVAYVLIGISVLFALATAYWGYGVITGIEGASVNLVIAFAMVMVLSGIGHKIKEPTSDPS